MKSLNFKTFSLKKLLLTVLYTVIVSVFIGTTILFVYSIPQWIQADITFGIDKDSEALIELGKNHQYAVELIEEKTREDKNLYGEDYPAEEILLMHLINIASTGKIVSVYTTSVLIGIFLGTIIYIVAIQNIKGLEMIIELVSAFLVILILITFLNLGYEALINILMSEVQDKDVTYHYSTYIYDIESTNILIPYIMVAIVIYVVNMVKQKNITNKLNKQLQKN